MTLQAHQNGWGGGHFMHFDPSAFVADQELLLALERRASPVSCDGERVLFRQGDAPVGLYILRRGEVSLSAAGNGTAPMQTMVAAPGSLLGLPGVAGNQPYTLTATAHEGAQVSFVPREDFLAFMHSEPAISLKILHVLAAEVRSARNTYF